MKKRRGNIELKADAQNEIRKGKTLNEGSLSGLLEDFEKSTNASRRNFLKLCGYSFAVSALASCKTKISKVVPYVIAPEEIIPGEALYYASTYMNGSDYCSILVKSRDGRPIKIEGNPESGITHGGTNARVQASVLDIYDTGRFHGPIKNGSSSEWKQIDGEIISKLTMIADEKGRIVLLTPSIYSPSTEAVISDFLKKYKGSEWIQYDPVSYSAMLEANKYSFGMQVIPDYRFDIADVVVSFGADFLGTWLSPIEYAGRFSTRRDPDQKMNYLVQLESNLSLTGCNADRRIRIKPSDETVILLNLYQQINKAINNRSIDVPSLPVDISGIAERLISAKRKSIVISRSNNKGIQQLVNEINIMLGNIESTILFDPYLRTHQGIDSNMEALVRDMGEGKINALLIWNVNPAYTWYNRTAFNDGLKKIGLTVSLSGSPDETNKQVQYVCPDCNYLESWNDAEAKKDHFSLMQPVIDPIFDTRQMTESLLKWSGSDVKYYDFVKKFWIENMMRRQTEYADATSFFDNTLQRGIFEPDVQLKKSPEKANSRNTTFYLPQIKAADGKPEVVLYEPVAMGEGRQSNNPWLHELPDPVSRICWDNYAAISTAMAGDLNLKDGDIITIRKCNLPVFIQQGQAEGTIGIALGYGRTVCGKVGEAVGVDVWQMLSIDEGNIIYNSSIEGIANTGEKQRLAQVQPHHSMEGRPLVRSAELKDYIKDPTAGNELHAYNEAHAKSLYKERFYPHHHWGMAIDLNKCIGCGTCVIACQSENNVPCVGKEQVLRVHEMLWMRIDRYYTGSEEDPEVVFQPVLCQHCQNAPCENVCPVAATTTSSEGLNQMIYNRCFGTRYCNNNCPYKVRRFNWFNFTKAGTLSGNLRDSEGMTDDFRRLVLNPDVTIRAQGVIEKCSFCIQRIQAAKLKAKTENRALLPGEVQSACAQSCPANAIVFGDMNDKESKLSKLIASGRRYNLLEELFTRPSVNYLTKINNKLT